MYAQKMVNAVLEVLRARVRPGTQIDESSGGIGLLDLGIDSMRLISIIVALESSIGLDFDKVVGMSPPRTVDDLLELAARGSSSDAL